MSKVSSGRLSKLRTASSLRKEAQCLPAPNKKASDNFGFVPSADRRLLAYFSLYPVWKLLLPEMRRPHNGCLLQMAKLCIFKISFQSRPCYQWRFANLYTQKNVFLGLGTGGKCWCFEHLRKAVRKPVWWTEASWEPQPGSLTLWLEASSAGRGQESGVLTSLTQKASSEHCPMLLLYNMKNK